MGFKLLFVINKVNIFLLAQFFQACVNLTSLFVHMRVVRSEYDGKNTSFNSVLEDIARFTIDSAIDSNDSSEFKQGRI